MVLRLTDRIGPGSIDLTLTRGNVLAELSVSDRPVSFLIPGLKVVRQGTASVTVGSSRGRWIFASDVAVRWQVSGDTLTVASRCSVKVLVASGVGNGFWGRANDAPTVLARPSITRP